MRLLEELKTIGVGEVFADEKTLATYSHDASLFVVRPEVVVFSKSIEDIKKLVGFVSVQKKNNPQLSLAVRSGGTDMSGGALGESIILDVSKHLNRISEVGDGYAVSEPGVYYRDFEKRTLSKNLLLPSYPASREICTVGGMVANNAGGEKSLRYGKTDQYLRRLKVVLSDGNEYAFEKIPLNEAEATARQNNFEGNIYKQLLELFKSNASLIVEKRPKVSKNSSGYNVWEVYDGKFLDVPKLFCGSQGTLGIITEINFKLVPAKPTQGLLTIFLKDISMLAELTAVVLRFKPTSFESFDDHTFKLALKFFPNFLKLVGAKNIFSLAYSFLPEFWLLISSGLPKLVLLVEFEGETQQEVDEKLISLQQALKSFPVKMRPARTGSQMRKYWAMRRESFNLLRSRIRGLKTAPFIDDIVVAPERLEDFLSKLKPILSKYPSLIYTIAGHVGDGNLHIIPLMNLRDEYQRALIPKLAQEVYDLVVSFGGALSGEHNDGLIRTPYLEKMYGPEMIKLFEEIKNIFDPQNIFNPGKKVGGSLEYALEHIRQE